jgi:hypothetical protein
VRQQVVARLQQLVVFLQWPGARQPAILAVLAVLAAVLQLDRGSLPGILGTHWSTSQARPSCPIFRRADLRRATVSALRRGRHDYEEMGVVQPWLIWEHVGERARGWRVKSRSTCRQPACSNQREAIQPVVSGALMSAQTARRGASASHTTLCRHPFPCQEDWARAHALCPCLMPMRAARKLQADVLAESGTPTTADPPSISRPPAARRPPFRLTPGRKTTRSKKHEQEARARSKWQPSHPIWTLHMRGSDWPPLCKRQPLAAPRPRADSSILSCLVPGTHD